METGRPARSDPQRGSELELELEVPPTTNLFQALAFNWPTTTATYVLHLNPAIFSVHLAYALYEFRRSRLII